MTELDDEVASLVSEHKAPYRSPDGAKERVFARVQARIVALPPGGGGGGGDGNGGGKGGAPGSAAAHGWRAATALKVAGIGLVFSAGVATGLVARPREPERIVYVDRVVDPSASTSDRAAPTALVPAMAVSALPSAPSTARAPTEGASPAVSAPASASGSASPSPPGGLAAERALLDEARAALARSDPALALAAVAKHEAQYPSGMLVEEREAMAVQALAAEGRTAEARARGERFRARFPHSVMLRSVVDAIRPDAPIDADPSIP